MEISQEIIKDINSTLFRLIQQENLAQRDQNLEDMLLDALGLDPSGLTRVAGSGSKRIRPLICCLVCGSVQGTYQPAMMYGAALEMFHNTTLVHDDIEDQGAMRHGKPALWKKWGLSLALNAGDYLYSLSYKTLHHAAAENGQSHSLPIFDSIAMNLFIGQHLDISFEELDHVQETDYLGMISGKTVALIKGSFLLGAIAANADALQKQKFEIIGEQVGLAFQMQDDFLGIWGDAHLLGKSVATDITGKKMSLPIIYALAHDPDLFTDWKRYNGNPAQVQDFADRIAATGADQYTREQWTKALNIAGEQLDSLELNNPYQEALKALIGGLAERKR